MVFKSKFFIACFFHFVYNLHLEPYNALATVLFGFALTPQIITNMKFQNSRFDARFVFQFILPRLAIFFFYRLFPFTLKRLQPLPHHVAISTGIFLVCAWVLKTQTLKGVTWFVPRCLRRKQFDYLMRKPGSELEAICKPQVKKGFWTRLIDKLKLVFSRDRGHKQFSKASLKTVNLGHTSGYGELQSASSISTETGQSDQNDVEAPKDVSSEAIDPCAICLGQMDAEEMVEKGEEEYTNQVFKSFSAKYRSEYLMKTPCKHVFHVGK